MACILLQISGERGIDIAMEHSVTPQRANACLPTPGKFIAMSPKVFNKLFPGRELTDRDKIPKGSTFETWITKIETKPEVKQCKPKQPCHTELNSRHNNSRKVYWTIMTYQDIKEAIQKEANERGSTISSLLETVLIDWLNSNNGKRQQFTKNRMNRVNHAAYSFGQLAAKEYEIFGTVSFEKYLFDTPGKQLTALKKKLVSAYKFTEDVGKLFKDMPPTFFCTKLNRRHYAWFFAGFCGIDWNVAEKIK